MREKGSTRRSRSGTFGVFEEKILTVILPVEKSTVRLLSIDSVGQERGVEKETVMGHYFYLELIMGMYPPRGHRLQRLITLDQC